MNLLNNAIFNRSKMKQMNQSKGIEKIKIKLYLIKK
jgi:hypothetical protein